MTIMVLKILRRIRLFFYNQMDDFSAKPGVPNLYGLTGTEANSIAPEKRMLSSMTIASGER
jgi:gamma-glutamyltranspeptidase